jgi:cell division protein FtsW
VSTRQASAAGQAVGEPNRRARVSTSRRGRSVPPLRLVDPAVTERAPRSREQRRTDRAATNEVRGQRDANRLTVLIAALSCFGLVIVLSASSVASITQSGSPWSLFVKQAMWTVFGVAAFFVAGRMDLRHLRRASAPLLVICGVLLVAVFAPGLSSGAVGGSSRWIGAGPLKIQPSELSKLAFCLFAADLVARRSGADDERRQIVYPVFTILGVFALLILKQPDMGTAIVLCCIALSILWASGVERKIFLRVVTLLAVVGGMFTLVAPYRRARLFSFVDPFAHASTSGYQMVQSLVALGSGHVTGTGLGSSVAKWGFLPNAWTDFIFAIIGNELGLIGSTAVLVAFAVFCWLGVRIASRTEDRFMNLLAVGITCWIGCQAIINIGGVVGVMPETGIPLPFLSSGGSSLVVTFAAVGILVNIARAPAVARSRAEATPERTTRRAPAGRVQSGTSERTRSSGERGRSRSPRTS